MKATNLTASQVKGKPKPFNRQTGHASQLTRVIAQLIRPQSTQKAVAVQPKIANGGTNRKPPVAPPVYRPQQVAKVLQTKTSSVQIPNAKQTARQAVVQPKPMSRFVQPRTMPNQLKACSSGSGRNNSVRVIQRAESTVSFELLPAIKRLMDLVNEFDSIGDSDEFARQRKDLEDAIAREFQTWPDKAVSSLRNLKPSGMSMGEAVQNLIMSDECHHDRAKKVRMVCAGIYKTLGGDPMDLMPKKKKGGLI